MVTFIAGIVVGLIGGVLAVVLWFLAQMNEWFKR